MVVEKKVGIEVEFLVTDKTGEVVIPGAYLDRDDFPILGEIRSKPGKNMAECLGNFHRKHLEIMGLLPKTHKMAIETIKRVRLKTYQSAMAQCAAPKNQQFGSVKNLYNTDISSFSDQIVEGGKIQGINISCGLHIHFSCRKFDEVQVEEDQYELVTLPIKTSIGEMEVGAQANGVAELLRPSIHLYKYTGCKETKTLRAQASLLNKPTVEYIVRHFDDVWFKKFAPKKENCTKYRQAGFYEMKPYGFEYRSLPANVDTLTALPEIVSDAFELLKFASN